MALLEALELQTGPDPVASIVVLHGLGADGHDFVPIAQAMDLSAIGPVRFVFPHAPVRPVTVNGGMAMRAWYDILALSSSPNALTRREDEVGLRASQQAVQALLDREAARGMPPERTVLMGFSQGCAMTLQAGLRSPQRLAGLAGLSGYLPLAATAGIEASPANRDVPLFLGHGTRDGVVPIHLGETSRDALLALGYRVEWHAYPIEHTVSLDEIGDLRRWLHQVLLPAAPAA